MYLIFLIQDMNHGSQKIYWDDKYGIVKYISQDDKVWKRININPH